MLKKSSAPRWPRYHSVICGLERLGSETVGSFLIDSDRSELFLPCSCFCMRIICFFIAVFTYFWNCILLPGFLLLSSV
uniref:Uncharacterized protein n=1 Tax=Anguilla anguilla TaxID=7936 RepID=A0A0E9TXP4_ANGAN